MKPSPLFYVALDLCAQSTLTLAAAKEGQIHQRDDGTNLLVQVQGSGNDDWRLQGSPDLATWTNLLSFGTLLSGDTNAPWRSVGPPTEKSRYFRAVKTGGLYDRTLLRTVSLTFTQANWSNLLALGRTYFDERLLLAPGHGKRRDPRAARELQIVGFRRADLFHGYRRES